MYKITSLTSDAKQKHTVYLPDRSAFTFDIEYCPLQQCWFINNITYDDFIVNGMQICNSPNMLHQFRNQLPFGLACFSKENREPQLQQDFISSSSILYVLDSSEVEEYTRYLSGE